MGGELLHAVNFTWGAKAFSEWDIPYRQFGMRTVTKVVTKSDFDDWRVARTEGDQECQLMESVIDPRLLANPNNLIKKFDDIAYVDCVLPGVADSIVDFPSMSATFKDEQTWNIFVLSVDTVFFGQLLASGANRDYSGARVENEIMILIRGEIETNSARDESTFVPSTYRIELKGRECIVPLLQGIYFDDSARSVRAWRGICAPPLVGTFFPRNPYPWIKRQDWVEIAKQLSNHYGSECSVIPVVSNWPHADFRRAIKC